MGSLIKGNAVGLIIHETSDTRNLTKCQVGSELYTTQQKILRICSEARKTLEREYKLGNISNYQGLVDGLVDVESNLLHDFVHLAMRCETFRNAN